MWNSYRNIAVIVLSTLITFTSVRADEVALKDFRGILVPADLSADQREAVNDLQYHLRKLTGGGWPIETNISGKCISIEPLPGKDSDDRWEIDVNSEHVILGGGQRGIGYAISLFLENFCGVRWLWPGPSGEVIPDDPDKKISSGKQAGIPRFLRRELVFGEARYWTKDMREQIDQWCRRTRQGNALAANFGHAWSHVIPPDIYFKKHPEWFALVNGKRITTQLCTSNPALRDEFSRRLNEMAATSNLDILSVSANDGIGFCECDQCRAKGTPGDAYWDFVNDIATRFKKAHPEKGIGSFAYTVGREPPSKIDRLPDNVYLSMTTYAPSLSTEKGVEEYKNFVDGWKKKGVKIVMREYWGTHYFLDLPVLFPDEIAATLKIAKDGGFIGLYGECGKNFATVALNYYVLTHLAWDPERKTSDIEDEFYTCFGPAKDAVRAYHEDLIQAMQTVWKRDGYDGRYVALVNQYGSCFSPEVLARAGADLERAEKEVRNSPEFGPRVAFLRVGFDYTNIMAPLLELYHKLGRTGFPLEAFEWEATARSSRKIMGPEVDYSRDYFEEQQKQPFNFTLAEKDDWLTQAWALGQERVKILNRERNTPALDEGLLGFTLERGIRQWQETIGEYLGKPPEETEKLEYTSPKEP